ncbi:MAG TPA: hypothetical protein VGL38_08555 [bacterium]|jgi:hypothetical protein
MTASILLRVLTTAIVLLVMIFLPKWHGTLSLRQAYSAHDALAGEHGLDRFAYVLIFALVYGFLIYLAVKLAPLFQPGDTLFWSLLAGALLTMVAITFWPKKRPPSEWHQL